MYLFFPHEAEQKLHFGWTVLSLLPQALKKYGRLHGLSQGLQTRVSFVVLPVHSLV
jgi:hypothetical protein